MYRHILIPTDGSETADHGVKAGLSLATHLGAKVSVIVVEASFDMFDVPDDKVREAQQIKKHSRTVLDRAENMAKKAHVPCECVQLEQMEPHQAIIETAMKQGCDLIVMASHGRSGLSVELLGSVTSKVLNNARIPVLVCR
jgi:nucleotide-binding universal stress UspA family protein